MLPFIEPDGRFASPAPPLRSLRVLESLTKSMDCTPHGLQPERSLRLGRNPDEQVHQLAPHALLELDALHRATEAGRSATTEKAESAQLSHQRQKRATETHGLTEVTET